MIRGGGLAERDRRERKEEKIQCRKGLQPQVGASVRRPGSGRGGKLNISC